MELSLHIWLIKKNQELSYISAPPLRRHSGKRSIKIEKTKKSKKALPVAQWLERRLGTEGRELHSQSRAVPGWRVWSTPGWGARRRQPDNVSLSPGYFFLPLTPPLPLSPRSNGENVLSWGLTTTKAIKSKKGKNKQVTEPMLETIYSTYWTASGNSDSIYNVASIKPHWDCGEVKQSKIHLEKHVLKSNKKFKMPFESWNPQFLDSVRNNNHI